MKFKNLRRPSRSEKAGIEVSPAAKRIKVDTTESTVSTPSASDEAAYDRHLQKVYDSQKWFSTTIDILDGRDCCSS